MSRITSELQESLLMTSGPSFCMGQIAAQISNQATLSMHMDVELAKMRRICELTKDSEALRLIGLLEKRAHVIEKNLEVAMDDFNDLQRRFYGKHIGVFDVNDPYAGDDADGK